MRPLSSPGIALSHIQLAFPALASTIALHGSTRHALLKAMIFYSHWLDLIGKLISMILFGTAYFSTGIDTALKRFFGNLPDPKLFPFLCFMGMGVGFYLAIHRPLMDVLVCKFYALIRFKVNPTWDEAKRLRRLFCLNKSLKWQPMDHVCLLPQNERLKALLEATNAKQTQFDPPPEEQIEICKKTIWIMAAAGPTMGCYAFSRLSALETGSVDSISVWGPVAMVYDFLGFWGAILCWPLISGIVIWSCINRINKARALMAAAPKSCPDGASVLSACSPLTSPIPSLAAPVALPSLSSASDEELYQDDDRYKPLAERRMRMRPEGAEQ